MTGRESVAQKETCIVMFSGGRDSSLSALRLYDKGITPVLVTISSDHLVGIDAVHKRLSELKNLLPAETGWIRVLQPKQLFTDQSFYDKTCLPCQHAYIIVAAKLLRMMNAQIIAMGYTSYQSDWPEQTPLAIECLHSVLAKHGIKILFPVYDIRSKIDAELELSKYSLSTLSLEQKCSKQITNIALAPEMLRKQIGGWEKAINESLEHLDNLELEILESKKLKDI